MAAFFLLKKRTLQPANRYNTNLKLMKIRALLSIVILFILSSCVKEHFNKNNINSTYVTIKGTSMYGFAEKESRAATIKQIPAEGNIVFYSRGGVNSEGEILSYNNGQWSGLENNKWDTSGANADIAAYYPVIKSCGDLYSENGELQDIVWCKTSAKTGENINLSFSHMFAKLVINIECELNDTVKDVKVNIPSKINGIDFYTGELSFEEGGNADITLTRKYSGKYEMFIPASNNANISLEITCDKGKKYNQQISQAEYKAGYEYICNIKLGNKGNGIYTTEDFIAFTHLINYYISYGSEDYIYGNNSLKDFYVIQDGKRVFNLYNDLSFTEEESSEIELIGTSSTDKGFNDIFNGNNHKLENIALSEKKYARRLGLFIQISENSEIKNLTLLNCNFNNSLEGYISPLVGDNYGLVNNCNVKNFSINDLSNQEYSSLVVINYGTIMNCSVSDCILKNGKGTIGLICYQNNGDILNCRIKSNLNKKPNSTSSSIISAFNYKNLFNIFIEDFESNLYGVCSVNNINGQYYNCIMPESYESKTIGTDKAPSSSLKKVIFYQDSEEEYQTAANALNEWIDTDGKELYPTLTFRRWTTDQTQKLIFE